MKLSKNLAIVGKRKKKNTNYLMKGISSSSALSSMQLQLKLLLVPTPNEEDTKDFNYFKKPKCQMYVGESYNLT